MKRTLLLLCLLLASCGASYAGEPNEPQKSLTFWLAASNPAYDNTDLSAMLGFRRGNIELGVAGEWRMYSEGDTTPDEQSDFGIGPFAIYHMPGMIEVHNPFDVPWLPADLAGDPFVGMSYIFDVDGKGATFSPFTGLRILDLFALTVRYDIYSAEIPAENQFEIGISAQWEF